MSLEGLIISSVSSVTETMASISSRYGTIENLHIHDVLAFEVQYRNNSTLIIQMKTQRLIKELYCWSSSIKFFFIIIIFVKLKKKLRVDEIDI